MCYISVAAIIFLGIRMGGLHLLQHCSASEIAIICSALVLLINRNQNFVNGEFEDGISYIAIVFFYIVAKSNNKWHKFIVPIMGIWIAIHTIITIMEYAIPGFYMEVIYPMMPDYSHLHLRSVFNLGYMPGLAVHYSTNGMYLGVSLIVMACLFIFARKKILPIIATVIVAIALFLTSKRALIVFPLIGICVPTFVSMLNSVLNILSI